MALSTYPFSLPSVRPGGLRVRTQSNPSDIPGPVAVRRRFGDTSGSEYDAQWYYTPTEMNVFRSWYTTTLLDGQAWFLLSLPGRGGMVATPARFMECSHQRMDAGDYTVQARLETRSSTTRR